MNRIILGGLVVAGAVAAYMLVPRDEAETVANAAETETAALNESMVTISLPATLSDNAKIGQTAFDAKCSSCHGANAVGQQGIAPPLVHKIYEPSHHGDEAFQRAVAMGVRMHHWTFGQMPSIDGLTRSDVATIISYIRELQQANEIF